MTRLAQALLLAAGLALWAGSRLTWVDVASSDGLGKPKATILSGTAWSEALVPLALLVLAAAVAVLAVRGWPLRLLAVLVAASSAGMAYLAISFWVMPDVAVRAAELAQLPLATLTGTPQRHYWGATLILGAALCTLAGAVLLIRAATKAGSAAGSSSTKYVAPAARRAAVRTDEISDGMSERMIWDALDEGHDPTGSDTATDNEGR